MRKYQITETLWQHVVISFLSVVNINQNTSLFHSENGGAR